MIIDLDERTISEVRNPDLKSYAGKYIQIYQDFMQQVSQTGIDVDPLDDREQAAEKRAILKKKGVQVRNDSKSLFLNRISPACQACQNGVGSATFFVSLRCHRNCFYCFNPNQEDYEYYQQNNRDLPAELKQLREQGERLRFAALTGGEPLLFKPETMDFFKNARDVFPGVYTRLYTSGDQIDESTLQDLKDARLDEIRFSIRMYDLAKGRDATINRIALARKYIPNVMVEMPVLPNTLEEMKEILTRLDQLGIFGINLLEFCYPYHNANIFRMKNYKVKPHPFRVLYDYWYAGGLPVAGSEMECLDLLDFAVESKMKMGVHYCSLENKHTGQMFKQNSEIRLPGVYSFSQKDYFIKSAKVFGDDIPLVLDTFKKDGFKNYQLNQEHGYLEFSLDKVAAIRNLDVEAGLAYYVCETREGDQYLRELKVDLIDPQKMHMSDF